MNTALILPYIKITGTVIKYLFKQELENVRTCTEHMLHLCLLKMQTISLHWQEIPGCSTLFTGLVLDLAMMY